MHVNLLCACWHLEAMKGSSSLTSCRLLILSGGVKYLCLCLQKSLVQVHIFSFFLIDKI
jgi:hypothetical protein